MTNRKEAGNYHLIIDIDYYIMVQENLTRMHSYKRGDETKGKGRLQTRCWARRISQNAEPPRTPGFDSILG